MRTIPTIPLALLLADCAGRDPQPVATTVQETDANATRAMITAEIQANNIKSTPVSAARR